MDKFKRQEVDRIGNIGFIYLSIVLLVGNAITYFAAERYATIVAYAYPIILEILLFVAFGYVMIKSRKKEWATFDKEELTEKEQKQVSHIGLRTGIPFGIFQALFKAWNLEGNLLGNLFQPKVLFIAIFSGLLYGISMHFIAKNKEDSSREE